MVRNPEQHWNALLTLLRDDVKLLKGAYTSIPQVRRFCIGHLWTHSQIYAFNKELQTRFNRSGARGKKVLDIGCGFGLYPIFYGLFGANQVVGVDLDVSLIDVFKKLLSEIPSVNNVAARCGDALKLDEEDNAFDVVVCLNSISHIRDTSLFIAEMKRVLRDRGIFYISDENNKLFPLNNIRNRIHWWRQREMRRKQRESVIRGAYPSLDDETLSKLVGKTAGMRRDEIIRAVQEFVDTGEITLKPAFSRGNPILEDNIEFEHSPLGLKRRLVRDFGFEVRLVRPFISRTPTFPQEKPPSIIQRGVRFVWYVLSYLYPLSLILAPRFEMVAICHK